MLRRNFEASMWQSGGIPDVALDFDMYKDAFYDSTSQAIYGVQNGEVADHFLKIDFSKQPTEITLSPVTIKSTPNANIGNLGLFTHKLADGKFYSLVRRNSDHVLFVSFFDPSTMEIVVKPALQPTLKAEPFIYCAKMNSDEIFIAALSDTHRRHGIVNYVSNTYKTITTTDTTSPSAVTAEKSANEILIPCFRSDTVYLSQRPRIYKINVNTLQSYAACSDYVGNLPNGEGYGVFGKDPSGNILFAMASQSSSGKFLYNHINSGCNYLDLGLPTTRPGIPMGSPMYRAIIYSSATDEYWLIPYAATEFAIVKIDPTNPQNAQVTTTDFGLTNINRPGERNWYTAIEGPDQKIYVLPLFNTSLLIIDPKTRTMQEIKKSP